VQGHTLEKLHEDVGSTVAGPASVEHLDDVRVMDGTGGPRFVEESPHQLCIMRQRWVQDLDGRAAFDQRIFRQVDFAEAALADEANNPVIAKKLARLQRHRPSEALQPRSAPPQRGPCSR
jgi:hypothetical protein